MSRTTLTKTTALGAFGDYSTANSADMTMTASSGSAGSNGNQFAAAGKDLVIAHNTGGSAYTITITSAADPYGRTGNITTYSLGAGEYAVFGPFVTEGWRQTDGYVYLEAENVAVKFGIVAL